MATAARKKTTVTKQKVDKVYKLTGRILPPIYILNSGRNLNLDVYDDKSQTRRVIRHAPAERSIFIDEQSDNPKVETIIFEGGYLNVSHKYPLTQEFLDKHPSNGIKFEEINKAQDAIDYVDLEETKLTLKLEVTQVANDKKNGEVKLRSLAAVLVDSVALVSDLSIAQLKEIIFKAVDDNPRRFLNQNGATMLFTSSHNERKFIALKAVETGVIQITPDNKIVWGDSKAVITNVPRGVIAMTFLTEFLDSEEGVILSELIIKKMK